MELGNIIFGYSRGRYEIDETFFRFLELLGCDNYGHFYPKDSVRLSPVKQNDRGGISFLNFEINPYWWGDSDDEEEVVKPNFIYKKNEKDVVIIRWYKYALRDAYSNIELTKDVILDMFVDITRTMDEVLFKDDDELKWCSDEDKRVEICKGYLYLQ